MTSYLLDNNYVIYALFTSTVGFMGYLIIKSYFYSSIIDSPNSPQTFKLSPELLKECQEILDNEGEYEIPNLSPELNKEVQDTLDNEGELDDFLKNIFSEEEYNQYKEELLYPENDFSQNLQDIFDNFDIF